MTNRAAIYLRISKDPDGLREGVDRQMSDCRSLAERHGFDVVRDFCDNDIGASTLSRKTRPAYADMLRAARAGEFGAIIAYSNSRLTRRPAEFEELIQLHELHGTRLVTCVSGEDNLATADGRMTARIKASIDAGESERMGERVRRALLERARQGKAIGSVRAFGWRDDRRSLDPSEADLIREAASKVVDGISTSAICRGWNEAGISAAGGATWKHTPLRRMLRSPRLAGIVTYRGEMLRDATGEPVRGDWEAPLTLPEWERLQVALDNAVRAGTRKAARRYLLSGIARCGVCGGRMNGAHVGDDRYAYRCQPEHGTKHTNTIVGSHTDATVIEVVKAHIARSGALPEVDNTPDDPTADRLARIPDMISELMTAYREGQLSAAVAFGQVESLEAERAELHAVHARHLAATVRPSVPAADDFDSLDLGHRRAILETVLEAVVIAPVGRKGGSFRPDRITYAWRVDR